MSLMPQNPADFPFSHSPQMGCFSKGSPAFSSPPRTSLLPQAACIQYAENQPVRGNLRERRMGAAIRRGRNGKIGRNITKFLGGIGNIKSTSWVALPLPSFPAHPTKIRCPRETPPKVSFYFRLDAPSLPEMGRGMPPGLRGGFLFVTRLRRSPNAKGTVHEGTYYMQRESLMLSRIR